MEAVRLPAFPGFLILPKHCTYRISDGLDIGDKDMREAMDLDAPTAPRAPRTATVLVFLAASAMIAAWLAVYALTNALIAVDLLVDWPRESDPRPAWMLRAFLGIFCVFGMVGGLFRWLSNRQLRRIDAIAEGE